MPYSKAASMNLTCWPKPGRSMSAELSPLDGDMVELALLLPSWQAEALQSSAHQHGQTAGQVLRALIGDYCRRHANLDRYADSDEDDA
ncbi:MAG: hypothetical protein JNM56_30855 [Planctomycetia bacterium]|nr:hypothetical protein [Planctomycetia bacterium]